MYCLRLFNVVLQELHVYYIVYCNYCGVFIEKYVQTKFHLDWLLDESLSPEAVYCCFTRISLFTET